ncbi:Uncharacterised protein [Klebsiella pneumoniae subsp. ozaenae]|uniref:Uncharacterized protein n=1 Tax=Klebsiella pneumoniae subsp. ozaenae TaxID=574 RepID=A0A377ZKT5_KLEPO|nr:Uncharacterised protein [Klebsiella pneumoniae subsp. ozaenae]
MSDFLLRSRETLPGSLEIRRARLYRGDGFGDVSALAIEIEFDEKKTKMSLGGRLIDSQRYITSASAKVTSTWHEYSTENLQLLFLSGATNQASAIVTGELLPADIKAGDTISLRHQNVFSVVLHSLVAGVDYLIDPLWGLFALSKPLPSSRLLPTMPISVTRQSHY